MTNEIRVTVGDVTQYFEDLQDPRSPINRRHPLTSVIVIAVLAVLAGAEGPTAIAVWANEKKDYLRSLLDLPHGIPQKDVFRRVLSALKPEAFRQCFVRWLESLRAQAAGTSAVKQPVLAVDGKTSRRSHDRSKGLGPLHSVSVWATEYGLSLGQVATEEKSNEITAIPELLRLVDIGGTIITIDAMGTQKVIAEQIVDAGADYVLALKGNQGTLHEEVIQYMEEQKENNFADVKAGRHTTKEKGHGREETRTYIQMPAPESLSGFGDWKGFRSIGMVTRHTVCKGKETTQTRYFISSLPVEVKEFARAVRGHWGIENSCHWTLDMTFREDESRIREKRLRENFAWLNRFSLTLLKQHPSRDSIAMKRRRCAWNEEFLTQVLTGQST